MTNNKKSFGLVVNWRSVGSVGSKPSHFVHSFNRAQINEAESNNYTDYIQRIFRSASTLLPILCGCKQQTYPLASVSDNNNNNKK